MDMTRIEIESSIEYRAGREAATYYNNNESATDASFGAFESGYIKGATEQRKIDIEKAVRWLDDNINKYLFNDNSNGKYRDWLKCSSQAFVDFRKAMEE